MLVALPGRRAVLDGGDWLARARASARSSPAASAGRTRWRTRSTRSAAEADVVLIHDAARPFVTAGADRPHHRRGARRTARRSPRCQSRDTVKQVGGGGVIVGDACRARRSSSRRRRRRFRREVLARRVALGRDRRRRDRRSRAGRARRLSRCTSSTGDAGEREDHDGRGPRRRAPAHRRGRRPALQRVGTGYDLHRLVEGRPLVSAA